MSASTMPYEIAFTPLADEELNGIRAFERRRIIHDIQDQLGHAPDVETKRKKVLKGVMPATFAFDPPLRELKIGTYRAFYDIDEQARRVTVRSVRRKRPDQTTEDVLHATGNS